MFTLENSFNKLEVKTVSIFSGADGLWDRKCFKKREHFIAGDIPVSK